MSTKETKKVAVKETVQPEYGYYSRLLKKDFDTVEALQAAEKEYNEVHAAEAKKAEEKKARAKEVEDAYLAVEDARKEAREIIAEAQKKASALLSAAEDKYLELKNKFIEDYHSYHVSYYNNNGKETISVSDLFNTFNSVFDDFFRF